MGKSFDFPVSRGVTDIGTDDNNDNDRGKIFTQSTKSMYIQMITLPIKKNRSESYNKHKNSPSRWSLKKGRHKIVSP